tara:strand:- start:163 stop:399 length:237 start_codon:yes stop_codon:yes gene_type:complete
MTIEILETSNIENIVITKDIHLGILKKSRILPVIVQRAIAIIMEAKNSMIISFKPHKINIEITKVVIVSKLVGFNLNN